MATHPGGWAAKAKIIKIMDVESFEKAILAHNFNPLQVFYRRGRQVRFFVCTMAGKAKPFDIIVFDKDGQAYVSSGFQKPVGEESIFNIQYFDGILIKLHLGRVLLLILQISSELLNK